MDEIHVSWQGAEKPAPSDLSGLLSVRRQVVERALVWLKKNNPHYADIEIDKAEMDSWEPHRTVVPPAERAMDGDSSAEIEEVLARLHQGQDVSDRPSRESDGDGADGTNDAEPEDGAKMINEITSSGMFALDGPPDVSDAEKLRFACNAVSGDGAETAGRGRGMDKVGGGRSRRYGCL
ncbi:PIF1-like helicase [Hirsutella rhossiliensis]